MGEQIVLVDDNSKVIGYADKLSSHNRNTPLHLAFSCYIFDENGKFLLTQRAKTKKVWPGVWTNSVCGHPAPNEKNEDAIARRANYELGMSVSDIEVVLPNYRYKTPPFNGVIENEICPVYLARLTSQTITNPEEVEAIQWVSWEDYVDMVESDNEGKYSWWCKNQLKQLKNHPLIVKFINKN